MSFIKELRPALVVALVLLLLCGVVYPYTLTGLGQLLAPEQANGSLLRLNDQVVGSALVGQSYTEARYMQGRPSAVKYNIYTLEDKDKGDYTGVASGSANWAATNPALPARVSTDMQIFLAKHPEVSAEMIPADLLTASGSGLDPHISTAAAQIQLPALAQHTGLSKQSLQAIVAKNTTPKLWGIFGEEIVHVLKVNMDIAQALAAKTEQVAPTSQAVKTKQVAQAVRLEQANAR